MLPFCKKGGLDMKQFIVVPDIHCPFHDPSYVKTVTNLIKCIKRSGTLGGIVQLADFVDFWQISSYPKDPTRRDTITEDMETYLSIANEWGALLPEDAVYHQIEGNHEHRLSRFIASHAAPIHQLVSSVEQYLKRGWRAKAKLKWHDYKNWQSCKLGDCYLMHGFYFNQHVAMTHLTKYKRSTIFGHTHRLQFVSDGEHFSATLGHGSNENLTAHQPTPTHWTQAIGVLTVDRGKASLQVVSVDNGRAWYGSKAVV